MAIDRPRPFGEDYVIPDIYQKNIYFDRIRSLRY
jgi:hypothetical protein